MKLTGKQARYLRGLGHHLKPVVFIGKEEVNVLAAVEEALNAHELIKVKLQDGCLSDRKEVAGELAERSAAAIAQILGRTILLYRPNKEQKILLPGA
ncbi:MAG: ribosome assembly RNA-binding protein YhbY [Deltaproteobacteria bacterium]|nr:ribosome assembly RNA-binding protein YhbY [Deltaproteobacteria bacterium]